MVEENSLRSPARRFRSVAKIDTVGGDVAADDKPAMGAKHHRNRARFRTASFATNLRHRLGPDERLDGALRRRIDLQTAFGWGTGVITSSRMNRKAHGTRSFAP